MGFVQALPAPASRLAVSKTRIVAIILIFASPALLLWDGLVAQAILAGAIALALTVSALSLRPGETEFLISAIRYPATLSAVPVLWILLQTLPLRWFANPIWSSAEAALGHPIVGTISIDPGASFISLGQYLAFCGMALFCATVAVDRSRAEWLLFALTGAGFVIAVAVIIRDLFVPNLRLSALFDEQATACLSISAIVAATACVQALERHESRSKRSAWNLVATSIVAIVTIAICSFDLLVEQKHATLFAMACGLAVLLTVVLLRHLRFGAWTPVAGVIPVIGAAMLLLAGHHGEPDRSLLLAFATPSAETSSSALTERVLEDAPLVGTGAGTFSAVAPIYREINETASASVGANTAGTIAVELGLPMFWLIVLGAAALTCWFVLAAFQRGRDSFYPAMGGACLVTLLLSAFIDSGMTGNAAAVMTAAVVGVALVQSRSRASFNSV